MTLNQIKTAVDSGRPVCWVNDGYQVIKDSVGQYLIGFAIGTSRENYIGLTWRDGKTLNGSPWEFYIKGSRQP